MAVVAARHELTPECPRAARGSRSGKLRPYRLPGGAILVLVLSALTLGAVTLTGTLPAEAQGFTYNPLPPKPKPLQRKNDGQMLVQATEVDYDYNNQRVSAVGNVQIYYNSNTVEADKVVYDEVRKRMRAEGNVRLTEPDGKITYANMMDLSDDFRDGFVDSLRLDTPDRTRMAAQRADRERDLRQTGIAIHRGVRTVRVAILAGRPRGPQARSRRTAAWAPMDSPRRPWRAGSARPVRPAVAEQKKAPASRGFGCNGKTAQRQEAGSSSLAMVLPVHFHPVSWPDAAAAMLFGCRRYVLPSTPVPTFVNVAVIAAVPAV